MGNWSELPTDLIWKISKQLTVYEDFTAFRGVCKSWRSGVTKKEFKHDSPGNVPWLMLAPSKSKDNQVQQFYSLSKKMVHGVFLPQTKDSQVFSSQGWLITVQKDWAMHLLHPFTRAQIQLPSVKTLHNWNWAFWATGKKEFHFIKKVALSKPPFSEEDEEECIVMIVYGGQRHLSFCKLGDTRWTYVKIQGPSHIVAHFCDLTYHQRKFYAVNCNGMVAAVAFHRGKKYEAYQLGEDTLRYVGMNTWYIVGSTESSLFLVACEGEYEELEEKSSLQKPMLGDSGEEIDRALLTEFYKVSIFKVLKMDVSSGDRKRVFDLGNKSMFVGTSSTMLVSNNSDTIYPDSIYFTDEPRMLTSFTSEGGDTKMGIYSLKDGAFLSNFSAKYFSYDNPPMWILPSY